jgi:hypothetical protein
MDTNWLRENKWIVGGLAVAVLGFLYIYIKDKNSAASAPAGQLVEVIPPGTATTPGSTAGTTQAGSTGFNGLGAGVNTCLQPSIAGVTCIPDASGNCTCSQTGFTPGTGTLQTTTAGNTSFGPPSYIGSAPNYQGIAAAVAAGGGPYLSALNAQNQAAGYQTGNPAGPVNWTSFSGLTGAEQKIIG